MLTGASGSHGRPSRPGAERAAAIGETPGEIRTSASVVEGGKRVGPGRVDIDDLVEAAHQKGRTDDIGQGAQRESGVPAP